MKTPKGIKIGTKYTVFHYNTNTGEITKFKGLKNIVVTAFDKDKKIVSFVKGKENASFCLDTFNDFYTLQ